MADETILRELYDGIFGRVRPETVAGRILKLRAVEKNPLLEGKIHGAARSTTTYMPDHYQTTKAPSGTVKVALDLFSRHIAENPGHAIDPNERDPARLSEFLACLAGSMHKDVGANNFLGDRLNRAARTKANVGLGNHAYNKRFRLLTRFEDKLARYERELGIANSVQIGKAGLVTGITFEQFSASPLTAAFLAYYVARKGRRSVFTNQSQSRAFDKVAEALLNAAMEDPACDFSLLARVYPEQSVVARMSDQDKGRLLGAWATELGKMTTELERLWRDGGIDLDTMVVKRGNDSSRWNIVAGAWNNARTAWMSMLTATGQQAVLDSVLPGKVMRLMAADVAYWHRVSGGDIHPDTKVWSLLPKPWRVLRGEETCTRADVENACAKAGIDPVKSGWVEAAVNRNAVRTDFTPELVHGVAISSPEMALLLRKNGVFSGKKIKSSMA